VERIESSHSIWLFDTERQRFRRIPRDADPETPALEADWQPYFALDVDETTGAFTVSLDADGSRLLRAFREDSPSGDTTSELRLPDDAASSGEATTELRLPRRDT
jgi:hypothetical protein